MLRVPKAVSVAKSGEPDGFLPEAAWFQEVLAGGYTRLTVSVPSERLETVHRALVRALAAPLRVLYVRLTDRAAGRRLDPPHRWVALDLEPNHLDAAMAGHRGLIYHDGRHQLWVQGSGEDRVVLEETGVMYVYPDDPSFRDVLTAQGLPEHRRQTMADRDFVRVEFSAAADAEELDLRSAIGLVPYTR